MATKTTTETTVAPKKRTAQMEKALAAKRLKKSERVAAIEKILLNVEKKMSEEGLKASLGDYIKLIQLSKEMKEEPTSEIQVTWIEQIEE